MAEQARKPSRGELRRARREQQRYQWRQYLERQAARQGVTPAEYEQIVASRRRGNMVKVMLALTGVGMVAFTGLALFALIITPIWFRSLPTSEQVIWEGRIPLLAAFRPTRVYTSDRLPTAEVDEREAMALLATPVNSPTPPPEETSAGGPLTAGDATSAPEAPLPTTPGSLQPSPAAPQGGGQNVAYATVTTVLLTLPRVGATSVLATNTPVLAPILETPTPRPTLVAALATPTATPTDLPPPVPTSIPIPSSYQVVGFRFEKQQWNTCGPANLTQALRFLGWHGTQKQIENAVKPSREDRNVSPWEMVDFVNNTLNAQQGVPLKALMRYGGDLALVKRLVANRFAVILEKGYDLPEEGWLGHYLTIQGYDDLRGQINGLDTYLGPRWEDYDEIDRRWQMFNRLYIVVYPVERERELSVLLGPNRDELYTFNLALSKAKEEASSRPDNPFAWFNLGTSYVLLRDYRNAAIAFDKSSTAGRGWPFRMLWYQFTPYEAYFYSGDYDQLLKLAEATLGTSQDLEESHYWRAMALAARGDMRGAEAALRKAVAINPIYTPAREALDEIVNGTFRLPGR